MSGTEPDRLIYASIQWTERKKEYSKPKKTIVGTHFILRLRMGGPIPPISYMPSFRANYFHG